MILKKMTVWVIFASAISSWYLFSRFTVDDAFITWRYGRNLIDFGVWSYGPSYFDVTQAYTNPIYAALSIIPGFFGWDVVLFFKLLSTAMLVSFLIWAYNKLTGNWLMVVLLVALPATVVHIYSGLETFLFVWLMAGLMIALYEDDRPKVVAIGLLLFVTRPEAWLLSVLLPIYYLLEEPKGLCLTSFSGVKRYILGVSFNLKSALFFALALGVPLFVYFLLHRAHFGSALPNTFYVKSGSNFELKAFVKFSFFLVPLLLLFLVDRLKLALMLLGMFGAMAYSYSTSSLQMDYAGRFAFHIFAPIFIFFAYIFRDGFKNYFLKNFSAKKIGIFWAGVLLLVILQFIRVSGGSSLALITYYPRALHAHAELGKILGRIADRYGIDAFSLGDAGMAPYHSKMRSLDNVGLGSSAVARRGVDDALLNEYGIDLVALYASPHAINMSVYHQNKIHNWAARSGLVESCDIYWREDYTLRIMSRVPVVEIESLCRNSKVFNNRSDRAMFKDSVLPPPWKFWRE